MAEDQQASASQAFSDSPWFWAYLFATAALIALAIIGPKYSRRQAQLERQFEGRQGAAVNHSQPLTAEEPAADRGTRVGLEPLYFGLAAVTVVVWLWHWRVRARGSQWHKNTMSS
jgi:hypothetical protein